MNKNFWKAAINRAIRTVAQVLGSTLPVGAPVTVAMVKGFDMNVVWAILAWLATGLLGGLASILTSLGWGIPEANAPKVETRTIYLDEYGKEIDPADLLTEPDGTITVLAYEDYDADGSPIVGQDFPEEGDGPCEECNLSQYVNGGADDEGDA